VSTWRDDWGLELTAGLAAGLTTAAAASRTDSARLRVVDDGEV
jgi:hypothetical protein